MKFLPAVSAAVLAVAGLLSTVRGSDREGVYRSGRVEIIACDQGHRTTPPYVAFTDEERQVDAAKNQAPMNPFKTIFVAKRLIGPRFDDPDVQNDLKHFPFKVINKEGKPLIQVNTKGEDKKFTAEEISAMVTYAMVTVPAYFNDAQRQATRDAAAIAGLTVARIINEPTVAAIAYGLVVVKTGAEPNILVYDLGGGTFDVSVLTSVEEDSKNCRKDLKAMGKLKREVEKAKRALSSQMSVKLEIESFSDGDDISEALTRAKFEELNIDLFKKTLKPVKKALKDAGLGKNEIDDIVLVGGSTRIPKVVQLLEDFFNGKKARKGINPDEAFAFGAAVQGGVFAGREDTVCHVPLGIYPLTLGIETTGGIMTKLIPRNTQIPTKKVQIFSTADSQPDVLNPGFRRRAALTKDNNLPGKFELTGIPPAPRDKGTGKSESITITNDKGRLSQKEIDRIILEAYC
ncbi:heat shock protein 70 family [Zopfochytrium polystomum]|nr:heat shock protein 70 family [Zopfochytrium polystomum]